MKCVSEEVGKYCREENANNKEEPVAHSHIDTNSSASCKEMRRISKDNEPKLNENQTERNTAEHD